MATKYSKSIKSTVVYEICEDRKSTLGTAKKYGIPLKTVEKWVTNYNKDKSIYETKEIPDKERIKELENKIGQLKRENDILKKRSSSLR